MSVLDWLFSVQSYFNLKDIPHNKKVAFAAMYLDGIALTWWKSLYLRSNQPTTWKEFQQEISAKFRCLDKEMMARKKLRNIKQGFSVEQYIAEFTNLTLQISDLSEPEACDHFKEGLKPHIQAQLLQQNVPNDLPLIQQVAHREDILAFNMAKLTGHQESNHHNPSRRHHFKKPEERRGVHAMENKNHRRDKKDISCYNCQKQGHMAKDCHSKTKKPFKKGTTPIKNKDQAVNVIDIPTIKADQ